MLPATVLAQITAEGSIRGVVRDEQGAVLPGVTITAMSPAAPRPVTAVSDAEGVYRLQNLLPGDYVIVAELQGFSRNERGGVVVTAGLNLTIDVSLKIGTLDETIQVTAEAPMLETESSSKAVNISGDLQRSLPLTSRKDFSDFLEVTPGVTARGFDQASGGQVYIVLERFHVAQRLGRESMALVDPLRALVARKNAQRQPVEALVTRPVRRGVEECRADSASFRVG
ncbi:MAG: carboxypeptidase-like regulatory domain-containing protein [Vicinamibacterales bacterium]